MDGWFFFRWSCVRIFFYNVSCGKYKRSSIIIMLLAAAMVISTFTAAIYGIYTSATNPTDFGTHNYCS